MKVLIMVITALIIPTVCFAGVASLVSSTFGAGGPCFAVTLIVGIYVGKKLISYIMQIVGGNQANIDMICRCAEVGIVISAVYGLLNTAFNLLGL